MAGIRQPDRGREGHPAPGASDQEALSCAAAAALWPRFASLAYEAVLLIPILFIAGYLFLAFAREAGSPFTRALFQLWLVAWVGAYFVYCWVRGGQTLAMKAWRLRLETADGRSLRAPRALLRYLAALAGLLPFAAGFLWALVDRDRQCLHDRIAGTRVVSAPVRRGEPAAAQRRSSR